MIQKKDKRYLKKREGPTSILWNKKLSADPSTQYNLPTDSALRERIK